MKQGYRIEYGCEIIKYTDYIVCDNYPQTNTVAFYTWCGEDPKPLLDHSTVAIFKLKWKS